MIFWGDFVSELEKLKERLKSLPKDFTYNEAKSLLNKLGFVEDNKGRTSGSRTSFKRNGECVLLHKPHPKNILGRGFLKKLLMILKRLGDIEE